MKQTLPGVRLLLCCLGLVATTAWADPTPRVTQIETSRTNRWLVCHLTTEDLPGARILSTLNSGLESSIEIQLELMGENGRDRQSRRYEFRLAFDLWEELYSVRFGDDEVRFPDLAGLRAYLSELPPMVVAATQGLDPLRRYRIRAGLKLHVLAPTTRGRMEEIVSGADPAARATGDGGQEVSVSMGQLIRFFYRGGSNPKDLQGAFVTPAFLMREVGDVSN